MTTLLPPIPAGKLVLHSQETGYVFVSPGDELTQGLISGLTFVATEDYEKLSVPAKSLSFTKEDILAKIDEHYKYLDHAFVLLGKDLLDPKGPRSRFARFVTGDFADEGKSFRAKSLQHKTAARCFYRFIKDTDHDTHIGLAKEIVAENWQELEELLTANCFALPKVDDVWLEKAVITNVTQKAFQVEGWGWVPKSKIKFVKGKMVIPAWIAQKILEKQEENNA